METMTNNVSTIHGWAKAAKAPRCSPTGLRRLVAAGPLVIPKDDNGIGQFSPSIMTTLREALDHGWPDPPGELVEFPVPSAAEPARVTATPAAPEPAASPPTPAPASAPAPADQAQARVFVRHAGADAAMAFRLLDGGSGPIELVEIMEIVPAEAMELYEAWKAAKIADTEAEELLEALDLLRRLRKAEWTCADLLEAWARVHAAEELYEAEDFTGDAALELLRIVRDRGLDFEQAAEALRALPDLEEQERLAHQARAAAFEAQRRVQEARQELGQAQVELRALASYVGSLRVAEAVEAALAGKSGALADLRDALAQAPAAGVADHLLAQMDPELEVMARRKLAALVATELADTVMLRSDHEAALAQARQQSGLMDMFVMKELMADM
jgi:tetratricopeptide (TPR) repeat protein